VRVRKTDPIHEEKAAMPTQYREAEKPRILIIGSTGRIGIRVIAEIAGVDAAEAFYSSRTREQVDAWHNDGKLLDLDRPDTFPKALTGVDRLFLATGYTVVMVHQSKTVVDAAADAGVRFIVLLS
jgi:uncharacterized protein YbjT (DUF2867 family)